VALRHPDGTNAPIVFRPGTTDAIASVGFNVDLTGGVFSFANWHTTNFATVTNPTNNGSFYPMTTRTGGVETDLAAPIGGTSVTGTWRLRAFDWCGQDFGSIANPVLTIYQFAN
jgi:hypothetical protein